MRPTTTVDFWFDPSCPYTFVTARWLREVATVRPIEVCWRVMSLSVLNEGRDDDPEGDPEGYLWVPARICAAVQREHGHAMLGRFYDALWRDRDRDGDRDGDRDNGGYGDWIGDLHAALDEVGLPRELADAGSSTGYDATLRASHTEGIDLVGTHVGSPVIATDVVDTAGPTDATDTASTADPATSAPTRRVAFHGPVLSQVPRGERAGRLWDGALLVAATAGFHELKGSPRSEPEY